MTCTDSMFGRRLFGRTAIVYLLLCLTVSATSRASQEVAAYFSPVDVALSNDGQFLLTVHQGRNLLTVTEVQSGRVMDQQTVGQRPIYLERIPRSDEFLVTCVEDGTLERWAWVDQTLKRQAVNHLGFEPHGVAIDAEQGRCFVALTMVHQIAVVDLRTLRLQQLWDVGRWPRYLAFSPKSRQLVVGTSGDRGISVLNTETGEVERQEKFVGLNIGHVVIDPQGEHAYYPWMVYRHMAISPVNIRKGWVMASRLGRFPLGSSAKRETMSLDPEGEAIADVHGIGFTANEQLIVSAAGTHELLVYALRDLPFRDFGGTDHVDPQLLKDRSRFRRIKLGGRPLGLEVSPQSGKVFVANYLLDCVQVVNLDDNRVEQVYRFGPEREPSLARKGEAIFYDATYSLDQWYSCHTCHYEGGTNASTMDTLNDGSRATFKTVLPLYQLTKTGPWTWHGWQTDLNDAMEKSITTTMQGKNPPDADVRALLAYFEQLPYPSNPFRHPTALDAESVARGKRIFLSEEFQCATCHSGEYFTDGEIHDVGLGSSKDRYEGHNSPSLRGVYRKVLLLHDGRSESLVDVLRGPHSPEKVSGSRRLTEPELKDLVNYLKTL